MLWRAQSLSHASFLAALCAALMVALVALLSKPVHLEYIHVYVIYMISNIYHGTVKNKRFLNED